MTFILLSVAAAVLLSAQAVYYAIHYGRQRRRGELRRRLRTLATEGRGGGLLRSSRMARSPVLQRWIASLPFAREIERIILQTDLEWTVAGMMGSGLAIGVAAAVAVGVILPAPFLLILLIIPVSVAAPILLVLAVRQRRSDKISEQLPDALEMMVRSLRAGHGVVAGFRLVTTEMPMPVAVEFGRCFEEQQAGASLRDAVGNMTERVPGNLDLRIFATSLIIQHETGGNLIEILESISRTVRSRYSFYGRLRAVTSEARMSGRILGALPFACALVVTVLNFEYMTPLFTDSAGNFIIAAGLLFWVAGVVWMRKLAQVEY